MNHAGIVSGCNQCHSGQFGGDIVSKPPASLHIVTTAPCEACHFSTTTFLGASFNHATTTVAGVCNSCHGVHLGVMGKPANHIPTTAQCDVCHTAALSAGYTTFLGAKYDHITPPSAGNCSTCHTGQYAGAQGKPAAHLPSTGQCDTCHSNTANFTTWLGATVNHLVPPVTTTASCATCHNGVSATGKPAFHIPTAAGLDCGNSSCHTSTNTNNYTTFFGATFTHTAITGRCDACHNGTSATGKGTTHVSTTADCVTCHTQTNTANYTTFLGASYTHSPNPPTAGSCTTCHNGATATGKPTWHVATVASCDQCHTQANTANYTTFLGATGADHATMSPPAAGRCGAGGCHDGVGAKGKSTGHIPVGTLSCDSGGCHAVYNGTTVISFANATMSHAVVAATRCDACHNGSYTTQGTKYGGAVGKVSNHIPTTITTGLDCNTCHTTTTYTALSNWLTEKMNHNGAQGGAVGGNGVYCVTCHLSGTTYMGNMQKKSHEGASTAKDCSSSKCHKPLGSKGTTYINWN